MKIGVLAPRTSWHFQDLARAASTMSDFDIDLVSVDFCSLAAVVGQVRKPLFFDGSAAVDDLDAVIVRAMPNGSLQQIVFRMDVLHRLEAGGMCVVNSPRSVEIAIDKYLSLSLMVEAGIAVPPFAVCQTVEQGVDLFEQLGRDVVLKPMFGSMGRHIHRFQDAVALEGGLERFIARGEVLYLQQYVDHGGCDVRVFVAGERTFSMRRFGNEGNWLTNVAQGGRAEVYEASREENELALSAAKVNRCQIAGVDLVYPLGSDEPMVIEVNASPGWQSLQGVTDEDIASIVIDVVCERVNGRSYPSKTETYLRQSAQQSTRQENS